ncbi:MAG: 16S rRNA (cytosine(1402)-N(4))-methyltransferase RsmH [Ignavibacteriae bacterium]|nr:16S rRNA (cytosine(1402)-N(4))-methyltransferase RsmH [Ignavibacteriota bacterium]MCB9206951.1 16S rRNA (cytosine(1402)-N(4))-methyltransferase RsmH [Ignavibacteriales bacterium]MCB9210461.1 16S rRNA (cytosine(1402)-N(4))-methyltransferase RsmH [Ignavibacteriales bacterium]MCB9219728.1 16S rRNA (cytosine(1402)-N(4))-methyltransferase RsmH [Ignavibacteriales bacterium]
MGFHVPVLLGESTNLLIKNKTGTYFDATLGFGGHTSNFLSQLSSNSKLIATDKDANAYSFCENKFAEDKRVILYNTSFTQIRNITLVEDIDGYDGIFADLGVSSFQFDDTESGFTYRDEAVLDLRMDKTVGKPAYEFVNNADANEIADVIYNYGEEKQSRQIARSIVKERETEFIKTTLQLKSAIQKCVHFKHLNKTLSRVFQALRIYVNNELEELKEFLTKAIELLKSGGRIVILSYHSLEDRIVKEFFKYEALSCVCSTETPVCICNKERRLKILTRKPIFASEEEIKLNPRARSVRLRAAEKI